MSEASFKLNLKADCVDLKRLGVDSTWIHPESLELKTVSMPDESGYEDMVIYNHDKLSKYGGYDWLKKILIAQSLLDNISNTETGLSIRWAEPFDFTDENGKRITHHDWMIPAHGKTFQPRQGGNDNRQIVFQNLPGSDKYCMLLWGVGRGYNSSGTVQTVLIKRANIKTIEMVSISQLEKGHVAVFQHPCLFKRGDDCDIDVVLPEHYQGRDEIVLYGWICEPLGAHQAG